MRQTHKHHYKNVVKRRIKAFRYFLHKKVFSVKNSFVLLGMIFVGILTALGAQDMRNIYTAELLNTIAAAESNGNYDAYYGQANNATVRFTAMPVKEVLAWQKQFVREGSPSSAVGRYQFIDSTLQSLVDQLRIDEQEIFNEALQDKLAVALLERRGLHDYVERKISREEFAHNLSKEWAALPKAIGDTPERSYYAGDGLNAAQLSVEEIYASIATVRKI